MTGKYGILSIFLAVLFFACSFQPALAQDKVTDDKIRSMATEEVTSILKAIESKNYEQFSRDFSDQMKKAETSEKFLQLAERFDKVLGKLASVNFIGFYVQGANTVTLFKARFANTTDDVLIRLVLNVNLDKQRVTGLWFDSPALGK